MKNNDPLWSVQNLYIETAPFIYYTERRVGYVEKMQRVFLAVDQGHILVSTSVVTLVETLMKPLQATNVMLIDRYRQMFYRTQSITLLPVTAQIAESAAYLRARYNLRTPDALHVATALAARCDAFLTNDLAIKRVTEIRVLVLDELYDPAPNDEPASTGSV